MDAPMETGMDDDAGRKILMPENLRPTFARWGVDPLPANLAEALEAAVAVASAYEGALTAVMALNDEAHEVMEEAVLRAAAWGAEEGGR